MYNEAVEPKTQRMYVGENEKLGRVTHGNGKGMQLPIKHLNDKQFSAFMNRLFWTKSPPQVLFLTKG